MIVKIILIALGVIIVMLALLEAVNLLRLRGSIARYRTYWAQTAKQSGDFTYVALGDSAAQGIGASEPGRGYVGLLAQRIHEQTGKTVRIVNLSVSGATIDDVVQTQLPKLRSYSPGLVTLDIGSNDIAHGETAHFEAHFTSLLQALPANTYVANLPYFGGRIRRNAEVTTANRAIEKLVPAHGMRLVDLYSITHDHQSLRNYAADLFHPTNRGYQNWADAFWAAIQPKL